MRKKLFLLSIIGCLLMGNLTIFAKENTLIEVPQASIDVVSPEKAAIGTTSNPSLTACVVGIGIADNGIHITFDTTATEPANEIGFKNVTIKEKTLSGWKDIPVSNYCSYNSEYYSGSFVYTGAVKGKTYFVECTHYAKFGNKELTLKNSSSEQTYN